VKEIILGIDLLMPIDPLLSATWLTSMTWGSLFIHIMAQVNKGFEEKGT
jgi:hypothetical protein